MDDVIVDDSATDNHNPCQHLNDGNYPATRDIFTYIQCKDHKTTIITCQEKNTIYEPGQRRCVDITTQNHGNFCRNRANGDWRYPWNCHKFVKCYFGFLYLFDCQLPNLVYNPTTDQCNYPTEYKCHQI